MDVMKKYMPLILLFVLINYSSYAQKEYSVANLEQASQEELNTYLDKALKLQKSGKTVAWVGVITFGVSTATMFAREVKEAGFDCCSQQATKAIIGDSQIWSILRWKF